MTSFHHNIRLLWQPLRSKILTVEEAMKNFHLQIHFLHSGTKTLACSKHCRYTVSTQTETLIPSQTFFIEKQIYFFKNILSVAGKTDILLPHLLAMDSMHMLWAVHHHISCFIQLKTKLPACFYHCSHLLFDIIQHVINTCTDGVIWQWYLFDFLGSLMPTGHVYRVYSCRFHQFLANGVWFLCFAILQAVW